MSEKCKEIRPPRGLRGRRARRFWRELAPIAAGNGTLSRSSAPLLAALCVKLGFLEEEPHGLHKDLLLQIEKLRRSFAFNSDKRD